MAIVSRIAQPWEPIWTPGPWEVRAYEPDSPEYDDGLRAWVANHRERVFIADVVDAKNGPVIAAAPATTQILEAIVRSTYREAALPSDRVPHELLARGARHLRDLYLETG